MAQQLKKSDEEILAEVMAVTLSSFEFKVKEISLKDEQTEKLQPFNFEVVTVDAHGQFVNRETQQAFSFVELLVEGIENYSGNDKQIEQQQQLFYLSNEKNNLSEEKKSLQNNLIYVNSPAEQAKLQQNFELPLQQTQLRFIGLEMVAIPRGTFIMGSPPEELKRQKDESPQHSVTVRPFFMGKYQITQAQWRFVAQLPQVTRELKPDPSRFKGDNRPVESVSWKDTVEFCDRLSNHTKRQYRLPSEAEWEYACRAGTTTPFHFGETITTDLANYHGDYTYGDGIKGINQKETTEVDSFGLANNFGLYDMHGNVREWCQDVWHSNYKGARTEGSAWLSDKHEKGLNSRVLRGGSWYDYPGNCRSASRCKIHFDYPLDIIGFRVVCSGTARTKIIIHEYEKTAQYFIEDLGNGIPLEMVMIPGGTFMMGSPQIEKGSRKYEYSQHQVTIKAFCLGKYQVTQAQWRAVAAFPQVNHKLKPDPSRFKGDNRPVEPVSWEDAVEFCDRLSNHTKRQYRLPSEAEWEYACRAGTTTPFHFGETITTDLANYRGTDNEEYNIWSGSDDDRPKAVYRKETTEVGSFGIANNFGLYDMHGNVYEWCQDHWHDNYEGAPTDASAWLYDEENNRERLVRGGSWRNGPILCRSAYRDGENPKPDNTYNAIGFRVVCGGAPRT
ncbi:formylglycine-generating enzyme family protein [Dolichospermum sp. UHCC 0259]|uniref:formylglycine-generating enzyme family protein n=1 Tax=Dolichospermum sp. UHCC 0259 TaxID=2590010 RepID=UPI001445939B|nr:formylglycine-generating enzyme family protein [Dolichospermum sp. UHCC 0259]MTJ47484.1 formylglycine-generating enzyme family protein [Dolichospermum sp. UHCC 0259]